MKITKYFKHMFVAAAALLLVSGCSGGKVEVEEVPFQLKQAPDRIVKQIMSDFQFNNLENVTSYFSKYIPASASVEICQKFVAEKRVARFEADLLSPHPLPPDATEAVVQLVFSYSAPDSGFGKENKKVEKTKVRLLREDGLWKIRALGMTSYDTIIEEGVFMNCLNAVMDTSIAMEKVRLNSESYSSSIAELLNAYPIDESACDELEISRITPPDENKYAIEARTRNSTPCDILFNADANADPELGTDSYSPKSFAECKSRSITLN